MAIKVIICLVLGYIFGCFQTGYFYGKLFKGIDVRNYGSGNSQEMSEDELDWLR